MWTRAKVFPTLGPRIWKCHDYGLCCVVQLIGIRWRRGHPMLTDVANDPGTAPYQIQMFRTSLLAEVAERGRGECLGPTHSRGRSGGGTCFHRSSHARSMRVMYGSK